MVEEDGGAVGGDFYDVFRGVGVGGVEVGDYGFVERFSCIVKDFGEAGLGGGEGWRSFRSGSAMERAWGPERRTMPMPPRPGGVEMATMVSLESRHFLSVVWGIFFGRGGRGVFTVGFGEKCDFLDGFLW